MSLAVVSVILHILIVLAFIIRILIRPHRQQASRIAWIVVIISLPVIGILSYILFGEVNIGRHRIAHLARILEQMPDFPNTMAADEEKVPEQYQHIFRVGQSTSGFGCIEGNSGHLLTDSNAAIDSMVADIDAAEHHVHILFYIWLDDNNGCKMVEALKRAADRGVQCRAMADSLGSRIMIKSKHWKAMQDAGVKLGIALPIGSILLRPFIGRIDLRNHRKIVIIDGYITYCGSQNCTDPEFRVKPKFAPWVDAMIRFEGPIALQNQHVFACDWMTYVDENLNQLLGKTVPANSPGFPAQVIATGPTMRYSAMPEMLESLIYAARQELIITTPYYVPDESLQNALCSASYRGVDTTLIIPARNNSWVVAAASRSYYADLLTAGVKIYEYDKGLLHTKSLTLDGVFTLIGSANIDRRSFELNYENNILFYDPDLTTDMRQRQQEYISQSNPVVPETVAAWPLGHRLWNNAIAMLSPLL